MQDHRPDIERARDVAETLAAVARQLGETLDRGQVVERIVGGLTRLLGARRVSLFEAEPGSGQLVCVATAGAAGGERWVGRTLAPDDGFVARALAADAVTEAGEVATPSWLQQARAAEALTTVLAVPLAARGQPIGVLLVGGAEARLPAARPLLAAFAGLTALALGSVRLYEEHRARLRVTEALLDIARATSSTLELEQTLKVLARRAAQALGATRCSINMWRGGRLVPVMSQFADGHVDRELWRKFKAIGSFPLEAVPVHAAAVRTRRPIAVDEVTDPRWLEFDVRAVLIVPLVRQDEVVGTLDLEQTGRPRVWTDAEIDLATTIANQAALTAENARLYREVRDQLRELRDTQAQLLEAGKLAALGQLVAGVAHELNNPLAIVMGHAELLKRDSADPRVQERTEKILTAGARAARIIRELITFARPQSATLADLQMPVVVERALELRRQALQVRGIAVAHEAAPDLPAVRGDEIRLQQVVLNLLLNAEYAAAQGAGPPRIEIRLAAEDGAVRLTVADSGPGIPPEVLPRIFEPFFTTKPVGQGTGLGLAICYRIVEAQGGRIWAESAPGGGARFVVTLPASSGGSAAGGEGAAGRVAAPGPAPRRGRVLVIEDEADVAQTIGALLEALGQDVTLALGGEEGWARLSAPDAYYDLVTLDVRMPGLPGPRVWERLVASGSPLAQRVAFVTGDTVDPETQGFLARAGRPVLGKPIDLDRLAALVAESQTAPAASSLRAP